MKKKNARTYNTVVYYKRKKKQQQQQPTYVYTSASILLTNQSFSSQ